MHNFCVRFRTLRNIWKEYKPDVILAFLGKNNLMAIGTAMLLPSKVVVSVRGEPSMEYPGKILPWIAKFAFGFADGIIFQTKYAKEFFPKKVQKKAKLLCNPLNLAFIQPKYEGLRENSIVSVGRLDENKNHALLIRSFAKIAEEFKETKLTIYGEGNQREYLEKLIKQLGMEERIFLPGYITDVAKKIYNSKCFVLSSNTEGMPNSIIEAMALGVPVISTDCPCGGAAMLIQDGVNGFLVPVKDETAMADAMRKILENQELAGKMSDEAYISTQKYHPDTVNKEWEDYLEQI